VQLTGRRNYTTFSKLVGVDLVANPDAAMQDDIAVKIMFEGMARGLFTGKKLTDYFTPKSSDWVNARKIINGLDRANDIAGYAKRFYDTLQDAA
jgi:predicted chitinase